MDMLSRKFLLVASLVILSLLAHSSISYAQTQTCSDYHFPNSNLYATCDNLPVLNSFLHWSYHQSNHTLDVAYRHTDVTASNWIAWCINPTSAGMVGSQCLVAFVDSTGIQRAYTSPVTSYSTRMQEANLSFSVPTVSSELMNNNEMIIYATVELPQGTTSFNHLWQHGDVVSGVIQMHPTTQEHFRSSANIDFATGTSVDTGAASGGSRLRKRNIHGVLNVVGWGIMMPLGVVAARYLKVFKVADPAWFYLHITCQASAYVLGVAGWATGLKLGSNSPGVEHTAHRDIGIVLFALATLQVFALLLRPKPDHKYRIYWNVYHRSIGYAVISLSVVNIFKGLDILDPEKIWKKAYTGLLIVIGAAALCLEMLTWIIVIKRKEVSSQSHKHVPDGTNDV